jgi:hypothetical protein
VCANERRFSRWKLIIDIEVEQIAYLFAILVVRGGHAVFPFA